MTSVMQPDPSYELALASQVPHTQTDHPDTSAVAVTIFGKDPPTRASNAGGVGRNRDSEPYTGFTAVNAATGQVL